MSIAFKKLKKIPLIFAIFPMLIVYGCGGGGSSGGAPTGPTYSGITTQAQITSNNGGTIASSTYKQSSSGGALTGVSTQNGHTDSGTQSTSLMLSQIFIDSFNQVKVPASSQALTGAVVSKTGSVSGSCGGTLDLSLNLDNQTGNFTGAGNYTNYCSISGGKREAVSGQVNISGSYNLTSSTVTTLSLSFTSLTLTSGSTSVTVAGNISINLQSSPIAVTFNFLIQNHADNKVYWVKNGTINITVGSGYVDITLGGRVYLPDYGYVDVSTTTPFHILSADLYPSSGVLIVTGSNNSKARLTALNNTTYEVDLDTTGSGTYVLGQPQNWSSI